MISRWMVPAEAHDDERPLLCAETQQTQNEIM